MAGVRRFEDIPRSRGITRTFEAGRPLPFLQQMPGESAAQLHARRVAAAGAGQPAAGAAPKGYGALESLIKRWEQSATEARASNIQRYEQLLELAEKGIARFQPGGAFETRGLARIEAEKKRGVGTELQRLIGAGLFGTEVGAGVERGWEADVGARARGTLEDIMQQRVTEAERYKGGIIERREDVYPDYGMMAQLIKAMQ